MSLVAVMQVCSWRTNVELVRKQLHRCDQQGLVDLVVSEGQMPLEKLILRTVVFYILYFSYVIILNKYTFFRKKIKGRA